MSRSINFGLLLMTFSMLYRSFHVTEIRDTKNQTENVTNQLSVEKPNDMSRLRKNEKKLLDENDVEVIRNDVVNKINIYRKHHKLTDLKVEVNLQRYAQAWADETLLTNKANLIPYNPNNKLYGETVEFFTGLKHAGEVAVDLWYYTLRYYDGINTNAMDIKEVTHLLSTNSTDIGVGVSGYQGGRINIIVNYFPKGYDPNNYGANLPKIEDYDVNLAKTKMKNIEDKLNPSLSKAPMKYTSSVFPDGMLPGWESTMYPKEVGEKILQN